MQECSQNVIAFTSKRRKSKTKRNERVKSVFKNCRFDVETLLQNYTHFWFSFINIFLSIRSFLKSNLQITVILLFRSNKPNGLVWYLQKGRTLVLNISGTVTALLTNYELFHYFEEKNIVKCEIVKLWNWPSLNVIGITTERYQNLKRSMFALFFFQGHVKIVRKITNFWKCTRLTVFV